jgi:hypothetical protein
MNHTASTCSRRRADTQPRRRDPITEAIATRAYELFLERGSQSGRDLDDWLQAERELVAAARSTKVVEPKRLARADVS